MEGDGYAAENVYAKNRKAVEDKITFKVHSIGIDLVEDLFQLFETDAVKVILYHTNKPVLIDLIDRALGRYLKILAEMKSQILSN